MKCFFYAFIGMLLAILAGFGLVWVFNLFQDQIVNDATKTKRS